MILEAIVGLVILIVQKLVDAVLPADTWTPDVSGVAQVVGALKGLNAVIPADVMLACLAFAVLFAKSSWTWDIAMWVWRHVPFIGK